MIGTGESEAKQGLQQQAVACSQCGSLYRAGGPDSRGWLLKLPDHQPAGKMGWRMLYPHREQATA
jgi:hypothetical protein